MPIVLKRNETPHDYRIKLEKQELRLIQKAGIRKILEVCSGDGRNAAYFAARGYNVSAVESSRKFVAESRMLLKKKNFSANIILHPVFGKMLPFKDAEFDFAYSYQYLNHNYRDKIEAVFSEIYRVLKKGGLLSLKITDIEQFNLKYIKADIYEEQDPEFPKIRYKKLAEQTFAKLEGDEKGIPHYGFYKQELVESLENAGFKIINIRKIRWNLVANAKK